MASRSILSLFFLLFPILSKAQTVDLSGTLKDKYSSAPVAEAAVTLVGLNLKTRTDAQGRFLIQRVPTGIAPTPSGKVTFGLRTGNRVAFRLDKPATVSVRIQDALGSAPATSHRAFLGAGAWDFHPGVLSRGIYFLHLESGGATATLRIPVLDHIKAHGGRVAGFVSGERGSASLAKTAAVLDSLRFSKNGYLTFSEPVHAWVQADLSPRISDITSSMSALTTLGITPMLDFEWPFRFDILEHNGAARESVTAVRIAPSADPANPDIKVSLENGEWMPAPADVPLVRGRNGLRVASRSKDGTSETVYSVIIHRANDSDATLRGLQVAGETLVPDFQAGIAAYKVTVANGADKVYVKAWATQPFARVIVPGQRLPVSSDPWDIAFESDSMRVPVEVTSPDGKTKAAYTIDIVRPSLDKARLIDVDVEAGYELDPAFTPERELIFVRVPANTDTARLTVTTSSNAEITIDGWNTGDWMGQVVTPTFRSITNQGQNWFSRVRNVGHTAVTYYTFHCVRSAPNDADLYKLEINPRPSYMIPSQFFHNSYSYSANFPPKDSVLSLTPIAKSIGTSITIQGVSVATGATARIPLVTGSNSIQVAVTAADGATRKTYTIFATRLPPPPKTVISGPSEGITGVKYSFQLATSGGSCGGTMSWSGGMHWGDGARSSQLDTATFLRHAWTAPGTYKVFMTSGCSGSQGSLSADTSNRLTLTIADSAQPGKVRTVSGPRMASETWSPDTLYQIVGKTVFEAQTTLTILPGTKVFIANDADYLQILGGLHAVGTAADSIRFEGGQVRMRWSGPTTYNADGSYKAGPHFEYLSYPRGSLYVEYDVTLGGGFGFYLKNSLVDQISTGTYAYARGSYIEKCRIGSIGTVYRTNMANSRLLNSYLSSASINNLFVNKCDIGSLRIQGADLTANQVSGNTIRSLMAGDSQGILHGNNFLPSGTHAVRTGGVAALDLQENHWGAAGTAEMEAKGPNQNIGIIWDYFDDISLGKVDYSLWKTAPIADAKPDW